MKRFIFFTLVAAVLFAIPASSQFVSAVPQGRIPEIYYSLSFAPDLFAACDLGDLVLGGGAECQQNLNEDFHLFVSHPVPQALPEQDPAGRPGWYSYCTNSAGDFQPPLEVRAVCLPLRSRIPPNLEIYYSLSFAPDLFAACDLGDLLLGGGAECQQNPNEDYHLFVSTPVPQALPEQDPAGRPGWYSYCTNSAGDFQPPLEVRAVCLGRASASKPSG